MEIQHPTRSPTTNESVRSWLTGVNLLPVVSGRLRGVQVENVDWKVCLKRYDSPRTLFYFDPPYVGSERVSGGYAHEMTDRDHRSLVNALLKLRGMVVLSGYRNDLYKPMETAGWRRVDFKVTAFVSDSLAGRTESLWLNPSALTGSQSPALLSPSEKMRHAAYQTHAGRVAATTRKVERAIAKLQSKGGRVTKSEVARMTGVARETLSRRYGHLFKV